jgi:hypothetical protein
MAFPGFIDRCIRMMPYSVCKNNQITKDICFAIEKAPLQHIVCTAEWLRFICAADIVFFNPPDQTIDFMIGFARVQHYFAGIRKSDM